MPIVPSRPLARRLPAVLVAVAVLTAGLVAVAPTSSAKPGGTSTVKTKSGLSLTATPVRRLPATATITVTGKGYDPTVGIYVALCVTPKKGQVPSPCGGGMDMTGAGSASAWISSNPPPYGKTLAMPFKKGGAFTVRLNVSPKISDTIDCRTTPCSIVTRADHTRSGDRRFDVFVPVTFAP